MTSIEILNANKRTTNTRLLLFDWVRIPYKTWMTPYHPNVLGFLFVSQGAGHYLPRFCGDFVIARYRLESSSSASKYLAALLTSDTVIEVVRQRVTPALDTACGILIPGRTGFGSTSPTEIVVSGSATSVDLDS